MPSRSRFGLKIEGLPLRLFGYRREDVRRWVDDLVSEDAAALATHQEVKARQESALAKTEARRRALEEILAHLAAETVRLKDQVERSRESASALEEGARREIERLHAAYEERLNEIRQAMPEVEGEIRRTEADLESMLSAMDAAVDGNGGRTDETAPTAQALSEMAVAIFGPDVDPDDLHVRNIGTDLFRTEAPWKAARIQTRSGELVGELSAFILHGRHLSLIGYEVTNDGAAQGAVPASDVIAVRRHTVIVSDAFRLLDAASLPREEAYTLIAIGSGSVRPKADVDDEDDAAEPGRAETAEDPAVSARGWDVESPVADAGWSAGDDGPPPAAWEERVQEAPPSGATASDAAVEPALEWAGAEPVADGGANPQAPLEAWPDPAWDPKRLDALAADAFPSGPVAPKPEPDAVSTARPAAGGQPTAAGDAGWESADGILAPGGEDVLPPTDPGPSGDAGIPAAASEPRQQTAPAPPAAQEWTDDEGSLLPPPAWADDADDTRQPDAFETALPSAAVEAAPAPAPSPRTRAAPAAQRSGAVAGLGDDVLIFLEGKIVGSDIYDAAGNLVAAAGTPIDRDLVAKVEAAGKLPDLIVYMTLPG